jgi:predicted transcriptional regulator
MPRGDDYNRVVDAFDRRSKRQRGSADPVARYLGELQAEVMDVFWRRGDATVRQVLSELNERHDLAYTTVLTLVSRLYSRGLLEREPEGRGFRYRATKAREEFLAELSDELIDRLLADFGEIAVARLGERLEGLDPKRLRRLAQERREQR